jgi:coenzyme F420 hydrogenase subunit beta
MSALDSDSTRDTSSDSLYHNSFKDMMKYVVDYGACCQCGNCVMVCPHNVIEFIDNYPKQTAKESAAPDYCGISEGIGCDVCASVCGRLWPREEHLKGVTFKDDRPYEGIFGVYRQIFVARTKRSDVMKRAQDGGVVTGLLAWALENGVIDGAAVSAVGEDDEPCFPSPTLITSADEIAASAGSWYTYCPNNLALEEAKEQDLKKIGFVGVPCQITPLRKMVHVDPAFLVQPKKKSKIIDRQRGFLRGFADRVEFNIGLFCTEVFRPELMTERIEKGMGIPLTEVSKFNVKGEVLVYKKDGDVATIPLQEAMAEYQRPACQHCGDFSAEMADIACGGVGTKNATVVVIRTKKGEEIWRAYEASGQVEVMTIEENKPCWNVMLRLVRRQRGRVPEGPPRTGSAPGMPEYSPKENADFENARLVAGGKVVDEMASEYDTAYGDEARPALVAYGAGAPIPGDPGDGRRRPLRKPHRVYERNLRRRAPRTTPRPGPGKTAGPGRSRTRTQ